MEKILVTDKEWQEIIKIMDGSIYGRVNLEIGSDKISIHRRMDKNKFVNTVFINGYIKGAETEENQKKYWRMVRRSRIRFKSGEKEKEKRRLIKTFGKKEGHEFWEKHYGEGTKYTYYIWVFESIKTLVSTYKKRHKEVYWLKEGD